jgi:hypothetical protein
MWAPLVVPTAISSQTAPCKARPSAPRSGHPPWRQKKGGHKRVSLHACHKQGATSHASDEVTGWAATFKACAPVFVAPYTGTAR